MPGTNSTIGGGGIHHVAIRTRDWDRSMRFYKEGLGFTEVMQWQDPPKRAVMLDTGDGSKLEVFERPDETFADTDACILHFALNTTDVDAAIEKARAAGAEVTIEPKNVDIPTKNTDSPTPVRLAFCKGPDGEIVEFFQHR